MPNLPKIIIPLLALALTGCSLFKAPAPKLAKPPPPATLLGLIEKRNSDVTSMEGRMSSKITGNNGKNSSTQLILLKKPAFIRLDALTPFGQPAVTLTTDGDRIDLLYHSKKRFFSGQANGHNISGILPSSLSFKDITLILSGGIPLINYERGETAVDVTDGLYRLRLKGEEVRQEVLYRPETMDISETIIYGTGEKVFLRIIMNKYRDIDKYRLPMRITTFLPLEKYRMEVSYSDLIINSALESELFFLTPPEGVRTERLDRLNL